MINFYFFLIVLGNIYQQLQKLVELFYC